MRKLTFSLLMMLLAVALTVNAYAGWSNSILYTKFNSTDKYYVALDKNYTATTVEIQFHLTFNTTTSNPSATVYIVNASGGGLGILVSLIPDYTVKIYYHEDPNIDVLLCTTSTLSQNETVKLTFDGRYLKVLVGKIVYIEKFNYNHPIRALAFFGSHTGNGFVVTDGWVNISVGGYGTDVSGILYQLLPTIISIGLLGACIGLLKKFT